MGQCRSRAPLCELGFNRDFSDKQRRYSPNDRNSEANLCRRHALPLFEVILLLTILQRNRSLGPPDLQCDVPNAILLLRILLLCLHIRLGFLCIHRRINKLQLADTIRLQYHDSQVRH